MSQFEFKLPDLGEGVHEGQIVSIRVKEGETIKEYEPMLEVETDKAAVEIPSPRSGVVSKINVAPGQVVKVGEVMLVIDSNGGGGAAAPAAKSSKPVTEPAAKSTPAPAASKPAPATAKPAPAKAAGGAGRFEFKLPDLGEGVHEGQIVAVRVKEGAPIKEYEPMLEVETDKAAVEIPSPRSGIVSKINVKPGQTVKVGDVMLTIDTEGAATEAAPARAEEQERRPAPREQAPSVAAREPVAAPQPAPARPSRTNGPVPAAPVVRKLARELGIEISQVSGSGPNGRILREDVERFALGARGGSTPQPAAARAEGGSAVTLPAEALPDFAQWGPVRRERPSQIRKTIARQMTRAWLSVPRVTHGDEVDITELERNRKELNHGLKDGAAKITMTAIVLKAVAAALREFPQFNCSYDAAAEEIVFKDYIHIGVAVDSPRGLVVPVVRDVDKKPLPQVARELNDVAERVRQSKFEISELRGASFTVTNVGALGGTFSTPMVNFPEVAIFGLGKAKWAPVVLEDRKTIAPRLMMPVFLSFDHRMCDGADAARFTSVILGALANPLRLISLG